MQTALYERSGEKEGKEGRRETEKERVREGRMELYTTLET